MALTAAPTTKNGQGPPASVPVPTRGRQRRRRLIAVGVLVLLGSALAGILVVQQAGARTAVLVTTRDVQAGQALTAGDLSVAEVSVSGLRTVPAANRDAVVGSIATARIPAGSLLAPGHLSADAALPAGTVVVGAVLAAGELPSPSLRSGDQVQLVAVGSQGTEREQVLGTATVHQLGPVSGAASGTPAAGSAQWVSLAVSDQLAPRVAQAASAERLRLIYLPPTQGQP